MKNKALWALCAATVSGATLWAANWPTVAGNPQRDGWAQGEVKLTAANAKKIQLLYKHTFTNKAVGLNALTAPLDLGQIIGFTGFHEFLYTGTSSGDIVITDADLNYEFKKTHLDLKEKVPVSTSALCSGGLSTPLAMPGGSAPARFGGNRGQIALLWALNNDGYLHAMRQQDGDNTTIPAVKLVPAGSKTTGLNISSTNSMYVSTVDSCNGTPNGLYAVDFTYPTMFQVPGKGYDKPAQWSKPASFLTNGSGFVGAGGVAVNTKGDALFGTVASGKGEVAGTYSDTVLNLDARTLTVKDYFTPSQPTPATKAGVAVAGATPAIFALKGKDYIISGDRNGRLYLLDSTSLGGPDHHTPAFATAPVVAPDSDFGGNGVWDHFATWVDAAHGNMRWVYASVHGAVTMKFPGANGAATNGGIVAFTVDSTGATPALVPAWSSADILSPSGPVTIGGLVATVSTGLSSRVAKKDGTPYTVAEIEKMAKPATLYLLDGATGAQVFTSGKTATTFATGGLTAGNGHVYLTTHDNTLYQFGIPEER